jgi:hypothetical protein
MVEALHLQFAGSLVPAGLVVLVSQLCLQGHIEQGILAPV